MLSAIRYEIRNRQARLAGRIRSGGVSVAESAPERELWLRELSNDALKLCLLDQLVCTDDLLNSTYL